MNNLQEDDTFIGEEAIKKKSDLWWYPDGPFWPLHKMNAWRLEYIVSHVCEAFGRDKNAKKPLEGLRVLDVGCGGGLLSEALHEKGALVVGIDPIRNNVAVATHHAERMGYGIDYKQATVADLRQNDDDAEFDVAVGMEVIEHVKDQQSFVRHMTELTKKDGLIFMSTISRTLPALVFAKFAAEYILKLLPKGTHDWREFVKPSELSGWLEKSGCEVLHIQGVRLNPFKKKFSYAKSKMMNYMTVAQK